MQRFAFVPALAVPTSNTRSAYICGPRLRSVRPAISSRVSAPFQWRSCAATDEVKNAVDEVPAPVVEESVPVAEPAVEEPVAEAAAEVPAEEPASEIVAEEEPAAEKESEENTEAVAEEKTTEEGDKPKRKRRRQREVTLPLEKMEVGMELEGVVKTVTNYGAFVGDMGTPTDGLLHVSQLAAGFVQNVTDVVQVGSKVKVRVTEINLERKNFSLSMKPLNADGTPVREGGAPGGGRADNRVSKTAKWEAFKHDEKVFIDARVSTITDFGAFCQLLNEDLTNNDMSPTDGLVHISEVSEGRVNSVSDVLEVGQIIKVRIVAVDRKRSRISLSMREVGSESSGGGRDGGGRGDRGGSGSSGKELKAEIKASNDAQPTFKTSFELAFERAGLKQNS